MSLLKKVEADIDLTDKNLLLALDVNKSVEEMLNDLHQNETISLRFDTLTPDENQDLREAE